MYDKCTYISSVPPQIQIPQVSENICKEQSAEFFTGVPDNGQTLTEGNYLPAKGRSFQRSCPVTYPTI